ncbi:MAG: cell wall hydrolase, partial [Firmicutes bacterium]|nr:cell wall hydrolase [Bacillota bacterium]
TPQEPVKLYTEADVEMLARLIYTEARGVNSKTEQAAVVWVVLNRLDNPNRPQKTIAEVICAPYQFDYRSWAPVTDEFK